MFKPIRAMPLLAIAAVLALAGCGRTNAATTNTANAAAVTAGQGMASLTANSASSPAPAASSGTPAVPPAEGAGKFQAVKKICAADLQTYCANADKPGRCLKEHEARLSSTCASAFSAFRAARKAERGAKGE